MMNSIEMMSELISELMKESLIIIIAVLAISLLIYLLPALIIESAIRNLKNPIIKLKSRSYDTITLENGICIPNSCYNQNTGLYEMAHGNYEEIVNSHGRLVGFVFCPQK